MTDTHPVRPNRPMRFLALAAALACAMPLQAQQTQVFTNFRLFDGTGADVVEDAAMLVRDGRIVAIGPAATLQLPADAASTDLGGAFVMPGMINAHGHVAQDTARKLDISAQYGITTVLSLGGEDASHVALRDAQDPAAPDTARLLVAGPIQERLESPADAVLGVAQLRTLDVDWVKARVMNGNMSDEVARVLVDSAHAADLKVAAHIYTLDEAKGMLRAGLDVLAHSVRDQPVDVELLELMDENQSCLIPTLTREVSTYVYADRPDFFDDPFFANAASAAEIAALSEPQAQERYAGNVARGEADLAMAQRNLKIAHDAGLRVALGTDSGAFADRFVGYFEHLELQLMVDAGLTPRDALLAATSVAADCMDMEGVGTLANGNWADFLVLADDPLRDIGNTRTLQEVWLAGTRFTLD
ncbi:MAG TPA: amidohydrolase family protein [Hyphomicrobiales bacterium]|nr:amidohydrolase family protein [Hyphomicrobiales bacterium]